jgi:hypothetical protein
VGPRAVLDAVVKRKIPSPHRKSNPRTLMILQSETSSLEWWDVRLVQGEKYQGKGNPVIRNNDNDDNQI